MAPLRCLCSSLLKCSLSRARLPHQNMISSCIRCLSSQNQGTSMQSGEASSGSSTTDLSKVGWGFLGASLITSAFIADSVSADDTKPAPSTASPGMAGSQDDAPPPSILPIDTPASEAQPYGSTGQVPQKVVVELPTGAKVAVIVSEPDEPWSVTVEKPKPKGVHAQAPPLAGPFQLPPPPYDLDALQPHMSQDTLELHWGKHHRAYVENLNKQVANTDLANQSLEEVIRATWNGGKPQPAFNNAAQVWNHTFFWECMKPGGGGKPSNPKLCEAIQRDFGSFDELVSQLKTAGASQFGSGWAWLVSDSNGKLKVLKTGNAVTPLVADWTPLLAIDVWEHAYYVDFQNRRPDYISTFLNHLVDWDAVAKRYAHIAAA